MRFLTQGNLGHMIAALVFYENDSICVWYFSGKFRKELNSNCLSGLYGRDVRGK